MADGTILTIKRPITVRAVVTPTWKEEAEREISNGIANCDQQLAQLESTCELAVGDNLVQKMQVSIVVRDGVVQAIEEA